MISNRLNQDLFQVRKMSRYRFRKSPYGIVLVTLAIGLILDLVTYFEWMKYAEPDWVLLILFYWCLIMPDRIGVGYGWIAGLMIDILNYSLLGQHAVAKAFVALFAVTTSRRIRTYDLWQQCIIVFFISSIDIGITVWIANITGNTGIRLVYWQSALMSALLWPVIFIALRFLSMRRRVG